MAEQPSPSFDPLNDMVTEVKRIWREAQGQKTTFIEFLMGFIHSIDWSERWIVALLAFNGLMLLTALFTRKRSAVQGTVFFSAAALVLNAERLNALGAQHWEKFARQNYFDKGGIFASTMLGLPLLIVLFVVLLNYLYTCFELLVLAKRKQLQLQARQRAKAAAQEGQGAPAAASSEPKKDR